MASPCLEALFGEFHLPICVAPAEMVAALTQWCLNLQVLVTKVSGEVVPFNEKYLT